MHVLCERKIASTCYLVSAMFLKLENIKSNREKVSEMGK